MCARGILLSDISLDFVRSEIVEATEAGWPGIMARFEDMAAQGNDWLEASHVPPSDRTLQRVIEARYKGQNHEVQVRLPAAGPFTLDDFHNGFAEAHRQEYGYDVAGRAVEVVNARLKAVGRVRRPDTRFAGGDGTMPPPREIRSVHFDTGWVETPIYDRASLGAGQSLSGPAIIDEMSSTTIVEPGQSVRVDKAGNLIVEIAA